MIAAVAAMVVAGCEKPDRSAETFGLSYDECILKNARDGGDQSSRTMAIDVCVRRFVEDVPLNLRTDTVAVNRTAHYAVQDYANGGTEDAIVIEVSNSFSDKMLTEVEVIADFSDKPALPNGQFPADAKITTLTWTFNTRLAPNEQTSLRGTFQDRNAPTRNWQADAYPMKWVPLGSMR
ncbi:hypothetical protein [Brevundimonas sp.]|uniref:hypothetical protein n=2 Tax=unclassified Brevundimonas TaxID=2622653 RepID=UPI002898245E|nr:hypothetical protein [Brevundimonas sp.]